MFRASSKAAPRAAAGRVSGAYGRLPLFWKLLVPFLTLIVVIGAAGGFLVVRDLATRTQAALDRDLRDRSLEARSALQARELYLLESANFAANLEGTAAAIRGRQAETAARLLQSVLALKTDLDLVAHVRPDGATLVEFVRANGTLTRRTGSRFIQAEFVRSALTERGGNRHSGLLRVGAQTLLATAGPICSGERECVPVGVALVGMDLDRLVGAALGARSEARGGVAIFDPAGDALSIAGAPSTASPPVLSAGENVRRFIGTGSTRLATLYSPLVVGDQVIGTLAVSLPAQPALASVRGTAWRLGLVLLLVMAGIVGLGALLSRMILRQVRSLLHTNRALGRGDLTARAHVQWDDELGELAEGVNETAEQLQASYATLELRVAQRTEEVERLLKERTQFFASVSHDVRTPLAVILRNAEMLLDPAYGKNGRLRAQAATALQTCGSQLQTLIGDILAIAQDEHGGIELDVTAVSIIDVMAEIRATVDALARSGGVRARIRVPKDLPAVAADRGRLREVLLNLADNAVKYTPEGGSLEVSAEALPREVAISVSDTGVGIPAEVGERLFEPFFRAEGVRTQQGQASSGLGLAVVKRLVEAMGGRVTYRSTTGSGTTFTFTLPTIDSPAREPAGTRGRGG